MDPTRIGEVPADVALGLAVLILEPERWINRRVEHVTYLDESTVRRNITVDFDVIRPDPEASFPRYVPIAQFVKSSLVNFDLRNADDRRLTMLTSAQNGCLSAAMLLALAELYETQPIDSIVEKYIPLLVNSRTEADGTFAWNRIFQPDTTVGTQLQSRHGFSGLADNLRRNFVLYLPISEDMQGTRQVVKLAFDAPRPPVQPRGFRERLGWAEVPDRFRVPLAGFCSSYHFEIDAPPEMEITHGRFVGTSDGQPVFDEIRVPTGSAHFHLTDLDQSDALVDISLRARSRELLGGIAMLSLLNAGMLGFVTARLHGFLEAHGTDAAVAALLVLPGLLTGYIVRPGEHPVLAGFLTDLRRAALAAGLTSFLAALILFAGYSEGTTKHVFIVLTILAALSSSVLVGSWLARKR
jgi:hypothetical protein